MYCLHCFEALIRATFGVLGVSCLNAWGIIYSHKDELPILQIKDLHGLTSNFPAGLESRRGSPSAVFFVRVRIPLSAPSFSVFGWIFVSQVRLSLKISCLLSFSWFLRQSWYQKVIDSVKNLIAFSLLRGCSIEGIYGTLCPPSWRGRSPHTLCAVRQLLHNVVLPEKSPRKPK